MTANSFDDFVKTVQTVNLDSADTRATAHTSAVFASDWDRVETALSEADERAES
jgi:hypothetical protein